MEKLFEILNIKEITSLEIYFIDKFGNKKEIFIEYVGEENE